MTREALEYKNRSGTKRYLSRGFELGRIFFQDRGVLVLYRQGLDEGVREVLEK